MFGSRRSRRSRTTSPRRFKNYQPRCEALEDRLLMAFDWSVPARFGYENNGVTVIDRDSDGRMDMHLDAYAIQNPGAFTINLEASGHAADAEYVWFVTGENLQQPLSVLGGPEASVMVPGEGQYYVTLRVTDDGVIATETQPVLLRDFLVVSIGDSIAAGEGVPEIPLTAEQKSNPLAVSIKATWADTEFGDDPDLDREGSLANRSHHSYAAQAAIALEQMSNKFSVTFVSVASSGARVLHDPENPWGVLGGGLLDEQVQYSEHEHNDWPADQNSLPAQLPRVAELVGDRRIDALFLSIGANDVNFAKVVEHLLYAPLLDSIDSIEEKYLSEVERLNVGDFDGDGEDDQGKYGLLGREINNLLNPRRVFLNVAHDPLHDFYSDNHDANGVPYSGLEDIIPGLGANYEEAQWAAEVVRPALVEAQKLGAENNGWVIVDSISDVFKGHGYTAGDERWVLTVTDSRETAGPFTNPAAAIVAGAVAGSAIAGTPGMIVGGFLTPMGVVAYDMIRQGGLLHPNARGYLEISEEVVIHVGEVGGLETLRTGYLTQVEDTGIIVTAVPGAENRELIVRTSPVNADFVEVLAGGVVVGAWDAAAAPNLRLRQNGGTVRVFSSPAGINVVVENVPDPVRDDDGNLIAQWNELAITVGINGSVQQLLGNLFIEGAEAKATMNIDDTGDTAARTVTVNGSTIAGLAPGVITYQAQALASFAVRSGSGNDTYYVPQLSHGPEVSLYSYHGNDTFHLGTIEPVNLTDRGAYTSESWYATSDTLHIYSGHGDDVVNVATLVGKPVPQTYHPFYTFEIPIGYDEDGFDLGEGGFEGGNFDYEIEFDPTPEPIPEPPESGQLAETFRRSDDAFFFIDIHGGNDKDTVNITPPAPVNGPALPEPSGSFLDYLLGRVRFDGENATDTLNVYDRNNPHVGESYQVFSDSIRRPNAGRVDFDRVEGVNLFTSNQRDTTSVFATRAGTTTTVHAGGGDDLALVGLVNRLDQLNGQLVLKGEAGSDRAVLNDQASPAGTYIVKAAEVSRGNVLVNALTEYLELNTGNGADTVNVLATGSHLTLNPGLGNDVVNLGDLAGPGMDQFKHDVTVTGTGQRTVRLYDQGSSANHVFGIVGNTIKRTVGSSSSGSVTVTDNAKLELFAGTGKDTLDYSASATGVKVNLKLGTATRFASVANVENVIGSEAHDLLVGNDGDNFLSGYGGHDLLIGGLGGDNLDGGVANDLLIAGATKFDSSSAVLDALFARWSAQDGTLAGYSSAVQALRAGVAVGGQVYRLDANSVYTNKTADDGRSDKVTGGLGLDWSWVLLEGVNADVVDALQNGEVRN